LPNYKDIYLFVNARGLNNRLVLPESGPVNQTRPGTFALSGRKKLWEEYFKICGGN